VLSALCGAASVRIDLATMVGSSGAARKYFARRRIGLRVFGWSARAHRWFFSVMLMDAIDHHAKYQASRNKINYTPCHLVDSPQVGALVVRFRFDFVYAPLLQVVNR
jgi:hypothetical protein